MKVFYPFHFLLFFLLSNCLQAQYTSPASDFTNQQKLSVDPLRLLWGGGFFTSEYGLVYNRNLNPKIELVGRLGYIGHHFLFRKAANDEGGRMQDSLGINGFIVGLGVQRFLGKSEEKKWFVSWENNYSFTHYQNKNEASEFFRLTKLASAAMLGHRWHIRSLGVEIDAMLGAGLSYRNHSWDKFGNDSEDTSGGEIVNSSWEMGWALNMEPSLRWTVPVALRLGYRF